MYEADVRAEAKILENIHFKYAQLLRFFGQCTTKLFIQHMPETFLFHNKF